MILCEFRIGALPPQLARVRDLSECGIKIATTEDLTPGERIHVRLPGACDWLLARVAWRTQGIVGLAFSRAVELPRVCGALEPRETPRLSRPGLLTRVR